MCVILLIWREGERSNVPAGTLAWIWSTRREKKRREKSPSLVVGLGMPCLMFVYFYDNPIFCESKWDINPFLYGWMWEYMLGVGFCSNHQILISYSLFSFFLPFVLYIIFFYVYYGWNISRYQNWCHEPRMGVCILILLGFVLTV